MADRALRQPKLLQLVPVTATQGELGPIAQDHRVVAVKHGLKLLDALDVHDGRTADPEELLRVQSGLQCRHCLTQHVRFAAGVKIHIVVRCLNPIEVGVNYSG